MSVELHEKFPSVPHPKENMPCIISAVVILHTIMLKVNCLIIEQWCNKICMCFLQWGEAKLEEMLQEALQETLPNVKL